MKNKILLTLTLTTLIIMFLLPLNIYTQLVNSFNFQKNSIDDNYIFAASKDYLFDGPNTSSIGLTLDDQEAIKNIEHVKSVEFNNIVTDSKHLNTFYNTIDKDKSFSKEFYLRGTFIPKHVNLLENLDYVYGGSITQENGIILNQQAANKLLLEEEFKNLSMEELIGKEIPVDYYDTSYNTFIIQGIYNFNSNVIYNYFHKNIYMDPNQNDEIGLYDFNSVIPNAFYTKKQSDVLNSDNSSNSEIINRWNDNIAWEATNYDKVVWDHFEEVDDDGYEYESEKINYEKSVENGVIGLIDPKTKDYGNTIFNTAVIEIDDPSNLDSVLSDLSSINNINSVYNNQMKFSTIYNFAPKIKTLLILFIFSCIIFLYNYMKKNNKYIILEALIIMLISTGIAFIIQILLPFNTYFINSFILLVLGIISIFIMTVINLIKSSIGEK